MKYVALLSGGKDSCYNLLHCARNGHQLIAAASLGPEHGKEELDSYLYQTVGQDAIELVARALDVPLYRQVIKGSAVEQGSEYGGRSAQDAGGIAGDETEDLYNLLSTVKTNHPDVQGVSVGAILSNYQRVRVEHVCHRLGLTSLAYLWQRDQAELLSEMVDAGMEAVLIKVAGIGLTTKHLGKTLAQMQPILVKLHELWGSHICGEGGEYETLTLDCPLFKERITLDEVETVIHSDNDFATVAFLRVKHARLEGKSSMPPTIRIPSLLDASYQTIEEALEQNLKTMTSSDSRRTDTSTSVHVDNDVINGAVSSLDSWVAVSQVQRDASGDDEVKTPIEAEVRECFDILRAQLLKYSLSLQHISSISVFLSDMALFPLVNAVFATYFGISPPARACVAVDLPLPSRIRLECLARHDPKPGDGLPSRQALHVQGLSYWAPANIGPYSQAILIDERIFISGQIGLIPSSLALPSPRSLAAETALCFQHAAKIEQALQSNAGGGWTSQTQLILYWLTDARHIPCVREANDLYYQGATVPALYLVVKSLPRDALVEKQVLLHTQRALAKDDDDDDDDDDASWQQRPSFQHDGSFHETGCDIYWGIFGVRDTSAACALICVRGGPKQDVLEAVKRTLLAQPKLTPLWTRSLAIRLFHQTSTPLVTCKQFCDTLFEASCQRPAVTSIPCRAIESGASVSNWDYALCIVLA